MSLRRRGLLVALALAALAPARRASAQATADAAAAEALFNEAQRLEAAGHYADACPKFAESLRLDSGIGVMLYLADCWERVDRTASAWAQFREAEDLANRSGDKRAAAAHQRAAILEPRLAKLVIHLAPGADVAGLTLTRDTTAMGPAQWGVPVPVDPGPHTIVMSAPGKKTRTASVLVTAGGAPTVFELAPLEDAPASATVPAPAAGPATAPPPPEGDHAPPPAASGGSSQRTWSLVLGGAGVLGVALGSAFGIDTISKNSASNAAGKCDATNHCTSAGIDLRNEAFRSGTVSTVAFLAGGAALAGAAVLYFTAPHAASSPSVGFAPAPDGRGGAVFFARAW